jgi:hypothetical protein
MSLHLDGQHFASCRKRELIKKFKKEKLENLFHSFREHLEPVLFQNEMLCVNFFDLGCIN